MPATRRRREPKKSVPPSTLLSGRMSSRRRRSGRKASISIAWCDRLGRWDLCSSPVDLEQRERRIQRFGGLTVRRPLAEALGKTALRECRERGSSPWDVIAREADKSYGDDTGMSPWWTMPNAELKRHLFALPQSRDLNRFARLRNQRLLYRLALGQPDQEDLMDLLANHDAESAKELRTLALDFSAVSHRKRPE